MQIRDRVGGMNSGQYFLPHHWQPLLPLLSVNPQSPQLIRIIQYHLLLTIDQAQHRCPINEEGVVDKVRRIDNEARDTPFLGVFGLRQSQMIWKWESGGDVVL